MYAAEKVVGVDQGGGGGVGESGLNPANCQSHFETFVILLFFKKVWREKKVWLQFRSSRNELKTPSMLISDENKTKTCQKMFRWFFPKTKFLKRIFSRLIFKRIFFSKKAAFLRKKSLFLFFLSKKNPKKYWPAVQKFRLKVNLSFLCGQQSFFYLLNNKNPFSLFIYLSYTFFIYLSHSLHNSLSLALHISLSVTL